MFQARIFTARWARFMFKGATSKFMSKKVDVRKLRVLKPVDGNCQMSLVIKCGLSIMFPLLLLWRELGSYYALLFLFRNCLTKYWIVLGQCNFLGKRSLSDELEYEEVAEHDNCEYTSEQLAWKVLTFYKTLGLWPWSHLVLIDQRKDAHDANDREYCYY